MFVPKDMPQSEWSIHYSASMRIKPFEKKFGGRVVCIRDSFLVMGEDEKDLLKYASATTYAIQRSPWFIHICQDASSVCITRSCDLSKVDLALHSEVLHQCSCMAHQMIEFV